jgi:hypothetical protein
MTITKIEVIKTNDQPTTTIEIAKKMSNIKMEAKTDLKMNEKIFMATKKTTTRLIDTINKLKKESVPTSTRK